MPDFQLVSAPVFSPTRCCACGSSACKSGFVDLLVEDASLGYDEKTAQPIDDPNVRIPTIGHLYLCGMCIAQAAKVADFVPAAMVKDAFDALDAKIDRLESELAAERDSKVVALADVRKLLVVETPAGSAA